MPFYYDLTRPGRERIPKRACGRRLARLASMGRGKGCPMTSSSQSHDAIRNSFNLASDRQG
jgi:hypothetical protein